MGTASPFDQPRCEARLWVSLAHKAAFIVAFARDGQSVACPPEWTPFVRGQETQPMLTLELGELQGLMDDLWRAGVRPTDAEGEVKAMRAHIEDLQHVARTLLLRDVTSIELKAPPYSATLLDKPTGSTVRETARPTEPVPDGPGEAPTPPRHGSS